MTTVDNNQSLDSDLAKAINTPEFREILAKQGLPLTGKVSLKSGDKTIASSEIPPQDNSASSEISPQENKDILINFLNNQSELLEKLRSLNDETQESYSLTIEDNEPNDKQENVQMLSFLGTIPNKPIGGPIVVALLRCNPRPCVFV